ncbi:hypothetical protein ACJRO7_020327 [Eucalyptus globulus]|uniref:Uncharacterized protein n=1 Tax=Eucalyptus globulus TaxID=34317 RepID=A0ABD3KGE2_EUCGL
MATARLEQPHHHRHPHHRQHIVVMRHGDRLDSVDRSWPATAPRRWDPPLAEVGWARARETAKQLPSQLGFPIHRIVVSPFRRCVDTALGLIAGLSTPGEDPSVVTGDNGINPSKVKVSIEYGLGELFNDVAIKYPHPNPVDHADWGFNIPEIETLIPSNILDRTVKPVFNELPHWGETETKARDRYLHTFRSLADSYPSENLLLITHGEAVKVVISTDLEDCASFKVRMDYCGYAQLTRQVIQKDDELDVSEFELLGNYGQTGICCLPRIPT